MARRALSIAGEEANLLHSLEFWSLATRNAEILPTSRERGSKAHSQNRRRKIPWVYV
jgi:hypothetical protein